MTSELVPSDSLSALRETAELYAASNYDFMSVKIPTVRALVECAEAIRQWRSSKSASAENDAYTAAVRALGTLEDL